MRRLWRGTMLVMMLALASHGSAAPVCPQERDAALACAAASGDLAAVTGAIAGGADVNATVTLGAEEDVSPLGAAVFSGSLDIVDALLAGGADPVRGDHDALMRAALLNDGPIFARMVAAIGKPGADTLPGAMGRPAPARRARSGDARGLPRRHRLRRRDRTGTLDGRRADRDAGPAGKARRQRLRADAGGARRAGP
ncbi:hypothetical protein ACFSTI_10315 [Rhizorhabdus histidinilytica]